MDVKSFIILATGRSEEVQPEVHLTGTTEVESQKDNISGWNQKAGTEHRVNAVAFRGGFIKDRSKSDESQPDDLNLAVSNLISTSNLAQQAGTDSLGNNITLKESLMTDMAKKDTSQPQEAVLGADTFQQNVESQIANLDDSKEKYENDSIHSSELLLATQLSNNEVRMPAWFERVSLLCSGAIVGIGGITGLQQFWGQSDSKHVPTRVQAEANNSNMRSIILVPAMIATARVVYCNFQNKVASFFFLVAVWLICGGLFLFTK